MKNELIGYARESVNNTILEYQIETLKQYGCTKIYAEIKRATREQYVLKNISDNIMKGDTLVVCGLDRLGVSLIFIIKFLDFLRLNGINFISLKERINTIEQKYFYEDVRFFSECEKNLIADRTRSGIQLIKIKFNRQGGRKKDLSPRKMEQAIQVKKLYIEEHLSVREITKKLNVGNSTVYKYLRALKVGI